MIAHCRKERLPFELFEALKARARVSLGLTPVPLENQPPLSESVERQIENHLLDACRATGTMLLEDGRVREGWMYFRPVGDIETAKRLIAKVPTTDENAEDLISVLLHEGVDIARGYQILLERNGTCNSITIFEQALAGRPKAQQRPAAEILLNHVYEELRENVRGDIARREGQEPPASATLIELLTGRRHLFDGGVYHLDTSHLSSTVRFARVLDKPESWQKAWELTQYGRQLSAQLQYSGEEPFRDTYPTHATFFTVLLDRQRDTGLAYFERKARSVDTEEHGTAAVETYIDLLDRIGRPHDALKAAITLVPEDVPVARILSWLLDLAQRSNDYASLLDFCQKRDDALSFATVQAAAVTAKPL